MGTTSDFPTPQADLESRFSSVHASPSDFPERPITTPHTRAKPRVGRVGLVSKKKAVIFDMTGIDNDDTLSNATTQQQQHQPVAVQNISMEDTSLEVTPITQLSEDSPREMLCLEAEVVLPRGDPIEAAESAFSYIAKRSELVHRLHGDKYFSRHGTLLGSVEETQQFYADEEEGRVRVAIDHKRGVSVLRDAFVLEGFSIREEGDTETEEEDEEEEEEEEDENTETSEASKVLQEAQDEVNRLLYKAQFMAQYKSQCEATLGPL